MPKTERLGVALTPLDKEAVRRLADAEGGLSAAALVRRLIRQEAQRRGLWPTAAPSAAPTEMCSPEALAAMRALDDDLRALTGQGVSA